MMHDGQISATILVVEDDSPVRRLVVEGLRRHGFGVMEAASGRQALDLAENNRNAIHLAIVDMVMPGMSGLDLAAELSRHHIDIKILYISGYVESIAMRAIADRTPDAVLLKPFTEQRLIQRVSKILGELWEQATDPEPVSRSRKAGWEGLMEASDAIGHPYRIVSYRDTAIAYSIAAVHAAVLREANLRYCFQRQSDPDYPFDLLVDADQWQRARDAIAVAGLGADIAIAA